jgi:predicted nucleic acid-binding protein
MIATDTSSLSAFFKNDLGNDTKAVTAALENKQLFLPAPVLTEILSSLYLSPQYAARIQALPLLEIQPGFWHRAGLLRKTLLSQGLKARLADTLIAQSCIDHNASLITRDTDFRHFAQHGGLKLF